MADEDTKPKKRPIKANIPPLGNRGRLLVFCLICVLLIVVTLVFMRSTKDAKPTTPALVRYDSRGPSKGDYQILGTKDSNGSLRVTVVIKKLPDDKLIAINDRLLSQYQSKSKQLFIDYFDDPEAAKVYFSKITDPKASTAQKKELASHYKALMVSNASQGKKLYAVDATGRIIKSY